MATLPQRAGASALPNLGATVGQKVVRLPTASRRKVEQRYNRHTREAMFALREQWPGRYIHPGIRAQMEQARLIDSIEANPALAICHAILSALPDDQRKRAALILATGAALKKAGFAEAHALVRNDMTIGDTVDLHAALDLVRKGEA